MGIERGKGERGSLQQENHSTVNLLSTKSLTHSHPRFHDLIHEIYPANHQSPQEHAIYGMSCLFPFPNPTISPLSNLRSINSNLSPSWPFIFFFYPLLGLCIGHRGLPPRSSAIRPLTHPIMHKPPPPLSIPCCPSQSFHARSASLYQIVFPLP